VISFAPPGVWAAFRLYYASRYESREVYREGRASGQHFGCRHRRWGQL